MVAIGNYLENCIKKKGFILKPFFFNYLIIYYIPLKHFNTGSNPGAAEGPKYPADDPSG